MWLTILTLPMAFAAPPTEGEKLLRDMERQLVEAKSLRIVFEIDAKSKSMSKTSGSLVTAEGNRARMEAEWIVLRSQEVNETLKVVEVSNGLRRTGRLDIFVNGKLDNSHALGTITVPKRFNERVMQMVGREGLYQTYFRIGCLVGGGKVDFEWFDPNKEFPRGSFKPPVKEKVGGRDAIRVEYDELGADKKKRATVTVWLDAIANLPIRRIVARQNDAQVVEDYKVIDFNPKVDPAQFVLPR